jgi:dTDP-4-amino-4,6-dideoxygalactose transaminase
MMRELPRRSLVGVASALALRAAPGRNSTDQPALLGGDPVRRKRFPSWPQTTPEDEKNWLDVLRACKWWRREGHYVTDFEKVWAERMGARHCVATCNGTSALLASLHALEVGPKDEVLVGPYTFIATVNAILAHYALPVFVDTDLETAMIDAGKIEVAITPRTRCILPVHLGGYMADMDRIMEISKRRGIPVVEDACQAVLSEWRGKKASTLGQLGCFSFQKFKNLAAGEAGAVMTDDDTLYRRAYGYHSHYRTPPNEGRSDPAASRNGINLRMAEFQAALLLAQMTRLEQQGRTREQNAAYLDKALAEIPGVIPMKMYPGCTRNGYYQYLMRFDERAAGLPRARFLQAVRAEGIPLSGGSSPLNKDPFIENALNSRPYRAIYTEREIAAWRERNHCPANDRLCREEMTFGQSVLLGDRSDMEDIVLAMRKVQRHAGALAKT